MGRRILFVTTDQQRYDGLGCNGGQVAATPVIDGIAASGVRFERAHPQNVVCMPSRSTIITGQHVHTHGVWMNGVPLPIDAPSVARYLREEGGYRTALLGKAHFEPLLDPFLQFKENQIAMNDSFGPIRGFEHAEFATHAPRGYSHYSQWIAKNHPDVANGFYPVLNFSLEVNEAGGGETGAPQVSTNPVPKDQYQTDWVADRTIAWLDSLDAEDDFFCWMSFPDPHHPWDPPASEIGRVNWRDLDLPPGYPQDRAEREAILDAKPIHWRRWYDGTLVSNYEAPRDWVPATLTPDQILEINARVHVKNMLIDEALGRVMALIESRGWTDSTDVIFTTDHGEFQGDYGLLFKGPYHVDSLMRLPMIWRPAKDAGGVPAVVKAPVGLVDLAPTFCEIAGLPVPEWMEGKPLPQSDVAADEQGRERVLTVWDSVHPNGTRIHLRTIYRDGWTCTSALPGTVHDGTEGELYCHADDPLQRVNRWDDPSVRALRDDLVADCFENLPTWEEPHMQIAAPV